jgi:hypothetical protein
MFFQRKQSVEKDKPRPRTRKQIARLEEEETHVRDAHMQHVLDSWICQHCQHQNRSLRSTRARRRTLECSNCRNDFIFCVSPRKSAHKALLDERPVQVCETRNGEKYKTDQDARNDRFEVSNAVSSGK